MFSVFLLSFIIISSAQAQNLGAVAVHPSNSSKDLSWKGSPRFILESRQIRLPDVVYLAPLTQSLTTLYQSDFALYNITGKLVNVDASNSADLKTSEIAFISCDSSAYPGELGAGETIANVISSRPTAAAVVLYSAVFDHCNYTVNDPSLPRYPNVFTLLDPDSELHISNQLDFSNGSDWISIVPDMSSVSGGPLPGAANVPTGSPNNAMIILYSLTGIITALFLGIIIMGAIRAHRNPERYGPRNVLGQPRQSRARGLARAMLETIPIVKFGDPYDPKAEAAKGDVEMASTTDGNGAHNAPEERKPISPDDSGAQSTEPGRDGSRTENANSNTPEAVPGANTLSNHEPQQKQQSQESSNYVCPICTDDFVKGQDLRVLPCNHQFHPECIDPWLVNVSGTCPLCRIDLNPHETEDEDEDSEQDEHLERPVDGQREADRTNDSANVRHRRGLSTYLHDTLNVRRMRDATVEERIAALRRVRQVNRDDPNSGETAEERQRRRSRLSSRLRERFRIRTRQHGQPPPPPPASES